MREWAAALAGWQVLIVQYPGRGVRIGEPFATSLRDLAADGLAACERHLGRQPAMLLGHSLGALLAYESAVQLERAGRSSRLLLVSGASPPGLAVLGGGPLGRAVQGSDDAEFIESLRRAGGLPAELLGRPEMLELALPALRSDFLLGWRYIRQPPHPMVRCPIVAVGGAADEAVGPAELTGWAGLTSGGAQVRTVPGDHFYFRSGLPDLRDLLAGANGTVGHALPGGTG